MATAKEETVLEKVEKKLKEFISNKAENETLLNNDLREAETAYNNLVKDIKAKYKVDELEDDIKKHTYFLKLLNNEVPIPDDLNAPKGKVKVKGFSIDSEIPKTYIDAKTNEQKAVFALSELKSATADEVGAKLLELEPGIKKSSVDNVNQTLSGLFKKGKINAVRVGRKYTYSIN